MKFEKKLLVEMKCIYCLNNFFAVQNLKMALKKQTFYNILNVISSDILQSIKRQNQGLKEHNEKYILSCGLK